MMVMATSSPGESTVDAKDLATRFSDSLVLRVNTISWLRGVPSTGAGALMRRAICSRTCSMASVASTDSLYRPRSGLAFIVS